MIFEANGSYKPPHNEIKESHRVLFTKGRYPYREQLDSLKKQPRELKIGGLVELLGIHHPDTLTHTFEDTFLAVTLAEDVFSEPFPYTVFGLTDNREEYILKIREVFEGALVHDIGKTGIEERLLKTNDKSGLTPEERDRIRLHGSLGGAILKMVGLGDLAHFSYEHSLGSGTSETWTPEQLNSRHERTEIVALADLIGGLLDPRRPYHSPIAKEYLFWIVNKKGSQGVYSEKLIKAFLNKIAAKDLYPPFKRQDYEGNQSFMALIKAYGIADIFEKTVRNDEENRSRA